MRYKDLTGNTYGRLTVTQYAGNTPKGQAQWLCQCECGGTKTVAADNLRRGRTSSCGCLANEQRKVAAQGQLHELSRSNKPREYDAWRGMLRRCYDTKHPGFARYGAAGIIVCESWRTSFAAFYSDMGKAPNGYTIDRIDNTKNYTPDNCRWATMKEQANNRSNNRLLTLNGETLNIAQWSERLGWHKSVITSRLRYGWPTERILTEQARQHRR